ncbi:MAG: AAA family ATPase [Polyangiaceae bacterium]|nr:AAA family ATPase [Polyangiaceae bacterium]
MARSDLLLNLVRAGSHGDRTLFRRTVEAIAAEERAKQHHVLADRLVEHLASSVRADRPINGGVPAFDDRVQGLLFELVPRKTLEDLILPPWVAGACAELVEEQHRRELLRSHNLEPRHRVLLVGPPGTGKTSLAEALAEALMLPLYVVRYDGIIGSYLGETAARLRRVFEHVRTRACVLFFDEFDTLGKERGDVHDTGEIKRVVSSLLLQVDDLPSHVVVMTATNHEELLDRAVWRRFQLRFTLPPPSPADINEWIRRFEARLGEPLGESTTALIEALEGLSFAEMEELCADVMRRRVLALPSGDIQTIVRERAAQWRARARPKVKRKAKRRERY